MNPESFPEYPAVYHLKNRYALVAISAFLILYSLYGMREESRSLFLCLRGFNMLIWTYMLLFALRRRLAIGQDGIEYNSEFSAIRASWSEVKAIETRRAWTNLWWQTEGLLIRTNIPDSKEFFIDLRQFGRRWRDEPLGAVLRMKAPHLFTSVPLIDA